MDHTPNASRFGRYYSEGFDSAVIRITAPAAGAGFDRISGSISTAVVSSLSGARGGRNLATPLNLRRRRSGNEDLDRKPTRNAILETCADVRQAAEFRASARQDDASRPSGLPQAQ